MQSTLFFQYCQKLIILSSDKQSVLLAKRQGEADYDGVYSFIGGKMETTDASIIEGMRREKNEEIGSSAKVLIVPHESYNLFFKKKDGNSMILPHIAGIFHSGAIVLNSDEYSDYKWMAIDELSRFEPKIAGIPELTAWALAKLSATDTTQLVEL
jgi:NADH pyrophosphatase NudC (nudix superfamily)